MDGTVCKVFVVFFHHFGSSVLSSYTALEILFLHAMLFVHDVLNVGIIFLTNV